MATPSFDHSYPPFYSHYNVDDITPPITPLKQRIKKQLSPINVAVATAHFQDARSRSNSPVKAPDVETGSNNINPVDKHSNGWRSFDPAMEDGLETPPLSAASTSGEVSGPLDAIHPLFSDLSVNCVEVDSGTEPSLLIWDHEQELGHPSSGPLRALHLARQPTPQLLPITTQVERGTDDSPRAPPPTPLLPSGEQFTPPRQTTDLYHYSTSGDSLVFFNSRPEENLVATASDATTCPSSTTMEAKAKRSQGRRKGKGRSITAGHATWSPLHASPPRRTSPARTSITGSRRLLTKLPPISGSSSPSRGNALIHVEDVFSSSRAQLMGQSDVVMEDADDERDSGEEHEVITSEPQQDEGLSRPLFAQTSGTRKPFGTTLGNTPNLRSCSAGLSVTPERRRSSIQSSSRSPSKALVCPCGRTFNRQDAMHKHVRMSVCRGAGLGLGLR
ncbi:hypothetical protein FRB93_011465 [Tulasnella sp. JGI-2019a]|nr:hypothetical protein FRB93_011465 [Tulasnella sp. JGI-2019a]